MRVLHIITGLGIGGAERALFNLLNNGLQSGVDNAVVSLTDDGVYGSRLRSIGVPVYSLELCATPGAVKALFRLRKIVREFSPSIVQGWMYHGNLIASLITSSATKSVHTVWNVRHSVHDIGHEKTLTRLVIRANALLSNRPIRIIYNSTIARSQHEALGFKGETGVVIPNGFDLKRFRRSDDARQKIRASLGIAFDAPVVGHVARFHPMKDQARLLSAFNEFAELNSQAHLIMAGNGLEKTNTALTSLVSSPAADRVHFLGARDDVPEILSAMDVFTLSSAWGEGFPNILGEAMACEVPCVTTDIGDSAFIVGEVGLTVPPRCPAALVNAWQSMLSTSESQRRELGARASARIHSFFDINSIVGRYEALYGEILAAV